MHAPHACVGFRLFACWMRRGRAQSSLDFAWRLAMDHTPRFGFLDDLVYLVLLFVPLTLLVDGSLALAALGGA